MYSGKEIADTLVELGASHVVWLPDSTLGPWEEAIVAEPKLSLVRVCREGEAWTLAAGLHLGGKQPVVMIQCTGLFESGDSLRNVLFDMKLPLFAVIGYRSYLIENSRDTARKFVEPVLDAWGLDYVLIKSQEDKPRLADHYRRTQAESRGGAALIAEGKM